LSDLKVKNLKNLITLHCYNNLLEDLNCSDLEYLEDLNCANNVSCTKHEGYSHCRNNDECVVEGFSKIEINNCKNLKFLDAAENTLESLEFPYLPSLTHLSAQI
jgi:Leucine-rich repeat (LRR) protein